MRVSNGVSLWTTSEGLDKHVLVTGAAGFLGSNMVDVLLHQGHRIIGLDNYQVGVPENIGHLENDHRFQMIR
ncbi:uncharacterized protein ATNIH1004_004716 [Aspergillus tanneri]|nr:uncharacterized protein ATNIH1004_004716 [Aspergillus tanneri]KAA8648831.1 hypothetical protein ATNIH1004_004716 [Aspergillus tanneri]